MRQRALTNPTVLEGGKKYLQWLKGSSCPQFRVYADTVIEDLSCGRYIEDELGATALEVYDLAIYHAGEAARNGKPAELAVYNSFKCRKQKAVGSQHPPSYAIPVLVVDNDKVAA